MSFGDLDLEFEDEEESKKKKKEAVEVDVDLNFSATEHAKTKTHTLTSKTATIADASIPKAPSSQPAQVKKIEDARAAQTLAKHPPTATGVTKAGSLSQPRVVGANAVQTYADDLESQHVVEMRDRLRKLEVEAEVKVLVAEFKTEYLTEMLSDMKLASHQVEQLLIRINAKHPDMKNEVLKIKKILADFTAKKRK